MPVFMVTLLSSMGESQPGDTTGTDSPDAGPTMRGALRSRRHRCPLCTRITVALWRPLAARSRTGRSWRGLLESRELWPAVGVDLLDDRRPGLLLRRGRGGDDGL